MQNFELLSFASADELARAIGRFDFVQPRAGGGAGQFVGAGEGKQFKVLHEKKRFLCEAMR